jgi:hypothetical protein
MTVLSGGFSAFQASRAAVGFSIAMMCLALLLANMAPTSGPPVPSGGGSDKLLELVETDLQSGNQLLAKAEWTWYWWSINEEAARAALGHYNAAWRNLTRAEYPDGQVPSGEAVYRQKQLELEVGIKRAMDLGEVKP